MVLCSIWTSRPTLLCWLAAPDFTLSARVGLPWLHTQDRPAFGSLPEWDMLCWTVEPAHLYNTQQGTCYLTLRTPELVERPWTQVPHFTTEETEQRLCKDTGQTPVCVVPHQHTRTSNASRRVYAESKLRLQTTDKYQKTSYGPLPSYVGIWKELWSGLEITFRRPFSRNFPFSK